MTLLALIAIELTLLLIGLCLVPILHKSKYSKFIKYVFPTFTTLGLSVLITYAIWG